MQALRRNEEVAENKIDENLDLAGLRKLKHSNIERLEPIVQRSSRATSYNYSALHERKPESLIRLILSEIGNNFLIYMCGLLLGVLAIYKVTQVQETRDVVAALNEIRAENEELDKDWLLLLAKRQNLSEHDKIRAEAMKRLKMTAPRTESEKVVYLKQ